MRVLNGVQSNNCMTMWGRTPTFHFCEHLEYQDEDLCYDGIIISDVIKTTYNNKRVVALVYEQGVTKNISPLNILYEKNTIKPDTEVVLLDRNCGAVSRILDTISLTDNYYFVSRFTQ